MLDRVEVHLISQSQPVVYDDLDDIVNTYTKDGLFCVMIEGGNEVHKFPLSNIFRVKEVTNTLNEPATVASPLVWWQQQTVPDDLTWTGGGDYNIPGGVSTDFFVEDFPITRIRTDEDDNIVVERS